MTQIRGKMTTISLRRWIQAVRAAVMAVAVLALAGLAVAQPVDIPPTWGGSFLDKPRLTGDWFGLRDELGKKGVVPVAMELAALKSD